MEAMKIPHSNVPKISMMDELKKNCTSIINSFESDDEEMNIISSVSIYKQILTHFKNGTLYDKECRKYIVEHFLEHSFVTLMERNYDAGLFPKDYNMADEITNCCKILVVIAVPLIKDDSHLAMQIIYYCMNCTNSFFTYFGHDFREKRGQLLQLSEQKQLESWRDNEIHVHSCIDYLQSNRWKYDGIEQIEMKQNDLQETYKLLTMCLSNDYVIIRTDTFGHISKPLTKSIEKLPHMLRWRKELSAETGRNKCDVLDSVHRWYTCTILEADISGNRLKIHYDGWSNRFDEFIYRDEKKCQPHLTYATGGRETAPLAFDENLLEPCIEDGEDPDNVFAVDRGKLAKQSFHLVDIMNEFGRYGGFDAIIERLSNHKPSVPWGNLRFILFPLSMCVKIYSKKTANAFIPKCVKLTFEILESLSDKELRQEWLVRIVESIMNFLKRFEKIEEIEKIIERFQLKMIINSIRNSNWGNNMVDSIIKLIAEYAMGYIINCSNTKCSEEILVYNQYSIPRKSNEYNCYQLDHSTHIGVMVRDEIIHKINYRYWVYYCTSCTENSKKCIFCSNNTMQNAICLNHPSCHGCTEYDISKSTLKNCENCNHLFCENCRSWEFCDACLTKAGII